MKLHSLAAVLLLQPATSYAINLPFKIPSQLADLKSKIESYSGTIRAHIESRLEIPKFFKDIANPVSASPLLSLHRSLVEIPSVTGDEHAVALWLVDYLKSQNFTVETQSVSGYKGDRMNVFAYVGTNRTTKTLLTSHIDTVPPFFPYTFKKASGAIYGRGSNDAKGSVAAQITATEQLLKEGIIKEGDVSLLYVVGEEITGDGMKTANNLDIKWNTVVFGEPTENKLAVGHKGIILLNVIAKGKASHSGYPHLGVNANDHLIEALSVLNKLKLPSSSLLGESTLNVGKIEGGVAPNVISAFAKAEIAVRVAGDLDVTIKSIKDSVAELPVDLEFTHVKYGPVHLDHDVAGFQTVICSYGTDVPNLRGDHKKYLYGPGS
jgi:acetylornithine deacetylase